MSVPEERRKNQNQDGCSRSWPLLLPTLSVFLFINENKQGYIRMRPPPPIQPTCADEDVVGSESGVNHFISLSPQRLSEHGGWSWCSASNETQCIMGHLSTLFGAVCTPVSSIISTSPFSHPSLSQHLSHCLLFALASCLC